MKKKEDISNLDKKLWAEYLKNPKDIFDKDLEDKIPRTQAEKYRFDLHGFTLKEANEKVGELINFCQKKGFKEILLITGKGLHSNVDQNAYVSKELSKLRYSVPEYIKSDPDISQYILFVSNAEKKYGGEGAIVIKLKNL